MSEIALRPVRDADAEALIRLIGAIYVAYPGCVLDVDGEEPSLRAPAAWFAARGGMMLVAEAANGVVGCCGGVPRGGDLWELKKLYVAAQARGAGLGRRLIDAVARHAWAAGGRRLELWSDTRFTLAHRLYAHLGFVQAGVRELHDLSLTAEYGFAKPLEPA